jgi:transposase
MTTAHPYEVVIGVDRSDKKIDVHLIDTCSGEARRTKIASTPQALRGWLLEVRQAHPEGSVALCLEQPASNLIVFFEAFSEWLRLFPVNPLTLKRFREAFKTSRANDDTRDAEYLARLLLHHHGELRPWQVEKPTTRRLQQLIADRRALIDERTALTNRLTDLLKRYFPQALELCGEDLWRPLATRFILKWPSLQAVQKARPQTVRAFYHVQGSRSQSLIARRLESIASTVPLTGEAVVIESLGLRAQTVARQLEVISRAIGGYDEKIAEHFAAHEDARVFESLPGAGPVLAPRLLAAMGGERERFASAAALQCHSGVAPVTERSGGKCHIHRRYACPKFLRQGFHEYARESVRHSPWAAAYLQQQMDKGSPYHTAVRALAFKWQRIIWRLWQNKTPYSEERYQAALRRAKSPLATKLPKPPPAPDVTSAAPSDLPPKAE